MSPHVDALVEELTGAVPAAVPSLTSTDDEALRTDLRLGVGEAVQRFLELVGTDEPALTDANRTVYRQLGAAEAREGRGFEVLLSAYNHAGRALLARVIEVLDREGEITTTVMLDLSEAIFALTDAIAAVSADGFTDRLRRDAAEQDRRRGLAAAALVHGQGSDPEALRAVGWGGVTRAALVLTDPSTGRELRFRLGEDALVAEEVDEVLLLVRGDRSDRLDRVVDGRDVVLSPAVPLAGLPDALRLARDVRRAAPERGTHRLQSHLCDVLLAADPTAAAFLRRTLLGELDDLPGAQSDRLVETLDAWTRHWGHRASVAAELHVHPQTVSYRVNQAREVLGDVVDDPARRLDLMLALREFRR